MTSQLTLFEYRPGRYTLIDEAGDVIRPATDAEADAALALAAGLPLFGDLEVVEAEPPPELPLYPDWHAIPAGAVSCPACRKPYPGYFTGDWLADADGAMCHWCSGGHPGTWQPVTRTRSVEGGA